MAKKSFLSNKKIVIDKRESGIFGNELGVKRVLELEVALIDPNPFQPRLEMNQEELQELADSIKTQGLIQPITVRKSRAGRYEIVAGHRRLAAVKLLEKETISTLIADITDEQMKVQVLIENIQRSDLNHLEVAIGIETIKKSMDIEYIEIGSMIGKSSAYITKVMSILKLSELIKEEVRMGRYKTLNVLYALNQHIKDHSKQNELYKEIINRKLNEVAAIELISPKNEKVVRSRGGYVFLSKSKGNVLSFSLDFKTISDDERLDAIAELEAVIQRLKSA